MAETSAERKTSTDETQTVTVTTKRLPKEQLPFEKGNVLHGYRSYTYNFTLAVLPKDQVNDPATYKKKQLDFVILKSGGKGTTGFNADNSKGVAVRLNPLIEKDDEGNAAVYLDTELGKELVRDFNKDSPGRFDMYINDVEIETLMAFTPQTNTSLGSGIKFDVFEPYSINGFIQALHVGAVAAGYTSYLGASFIFKMSFIGYSDSGDITEAQEVPEATRYFIIRFSGIDVELTEQGTRYRCTALPFHESGFGIGNILQNNIKVESKKTVKEVLDNFVIQLNDHSKETAKISRNLADASNYDTYEIKFVDENFKEVEVNDFGKSTIVDLLKTEAVYSFADYGDETQVDDKGFVKLNPNKAVVQFQKQARINECISAIIRDSEYTKKILKQLGESGNNLIDDYGMVKYFIVNVAVTPKKFDTVANKFANLYTYTIAPYRVHFTRIPRFQSQKFDSSVLKPLLGREYNYLYSGQNKDVLSFKLNFNTLFFEAVPRALGNSSYTTRAGALGSTGEGKPIDRGSDINNLKRDQIPTAPQQQDTTSDIPPNTGNAGIPDLSPFAVMARNMHNAIIDSRGSMLTGNIELMGDPIFLVTPSPGKVTLEKTNSSVFTKSGEINYLNGDVLIRINFRNPVDIGEDGQYIFVKNQVAYSGVYRVLTVRSMFRDGVFKQMLEIQRIPGQINNQPNIIETKLSDKTEYKTRPEDQIVADTTKASKTGQRARTFNLLTQLQDLASGAARFTSGVASSLTAPLSDAVNKFNKGLSEANANITGVTSKITSAVNRVNLEVAQTSEKLGISPQNLSNASPLALLSLTALAKSLPSGTDLKASREQGVNLNFPASKLVNLPPSQPKTTAPPAEQNQTDLQDLIKIGGLAAVASAFGTNSPGRISGSVLPAGQVNSLVSNFSNPQLSNPFAGLNNKLPVQDFKVLSDKSLAQLNQVSNSVEVNLKISKSSLDSTLNNSVTSKLGSKISSPLTRLNDNNIT